MSRVELVEDLVSIGATELALLRPAQPDDLLDEDDFAQDEFLPYWAELWPAATALARSLPDDLGGVRVVELGCGLGVPSLVAAARGAHVVATDWAADAVELLRRNAARNGLELMVERRDWRDPWDARFELALAADVLYEHRNVEPLRALLPGLAQDVLVGLAGRPYEADFLRGFATERIRDRVVRLRYPRSTGADGG